MVAAKERGDLKADGYQHVVVLVHGTFARGARWTRPDSPLSGTIVKSLGGRVLLTSFDWSGRNSHRARITGGAELAERLVSLRHSYPAASLHIVAHSHGGNIVAYALRSPEIQNVVNSVVCLGTPFIVAHPRSLSPTLRLLKFANMAATVLLALLLAFVAGTVGTVIAYIPEISSVISGALLTLIVGTVLFPVMRLLLWLNRYVEKRIAPRLRMIQKEVVTSLQGQFDGVPVLNVQTRGDEAAGYLRFVDKIAGIPFQLWSPIAVLWLTAGVTFIYVLGMAWVTFQSEDWRSAWNEAVLGLIFAYSFYVVTVVVVLVIVTLIALVSCAVWPRIFRGHALGFGEDGFMKNWLVAISASDHPPDADRSHNELLKVTGSGFRHSLLYQDERAIHAVAEWLCAQIKKQEGLSCKNNGD